jgi:O-antigen/teichoic acid export membrane protein
MGRMSGTAPAVTAPAATARVSTPRDPTSILRTFRASLLAGFSWNVLSAIALQGSVLLASIIAARLLGLASFGAYAILTATVMTIATIAQGGSGIVASKFVAESLASDPQRVARVLRACRVFTLATGAVTALLVFALAGMLGTGLLGRPELEPLVRVVAIATFFQVTVSYQFGALQGFGAFKELGRGGVLAGIAHVAFTAVGAGYAGLEGTLVGFVLSSGLRAAVFEVLLRRVRRAHRIPRSAAVARGDYGPIWRFALPAGLAGLVTMPCLWLVTVIVARLPDGLALVGILSVAHQVRQAVLQLPSLLNAVSFSVLSRLKGQNQAQGYREVFWSAVWMNLAFALLLVGVLVLGAEPVLRLFGNDFAAGRWVLVLLLASVLPELLATSFYQLVQSAGHMWRSLFLIAMPRDLLYLGLAALFVPQHGVLAAAAAYLAAHTVGLLATLTIAGHAARSAAWLRTR